MMRALNLTILIAQVAFARPLQLRTSPSASKLHERRPQIVGLIQTSEGAKTQTIHHWHPEGCTAAGVTCVER